MREYYDSLQTPYQRSDWTAASTLLAQERKKRKRRLAFYIAFPMLLIGSLISFWYFSTPTPQDSQLSPNFITNPSNLVAEKNASNLKLTKPIDLPLSTASPEVQMPSKQHASKEKQRPENIAIQHPQKATIKAEQMAEVREMTTVAKYNADLIPTANGSDTTFVQTTSTLSVDKKKTEVLELPNSTVSIEVNTGLDSIDSTKRSNNNHPLTSLLPEAADSNFVISKSAALTNLPKDSMSLSSGSFAVDSNLKNAKNSDVFVFELGLVQSLGWLPLTTLKEARGISPVMGISYTKTIHPKYRFTFGLRYQSVAPLSSSTKVSQVGYYSGYGEESTITSITPIKLYYLMVPFKCQVMLNNRHALALGFNVGYLMNVSARVTTYDVKPGYIGPTQTSTQYGYMQGFYWMDAQLTAAYTYKWSRLWALQSELYYGLMDVKDNTFFGNTQMERNSGLKVSLLYFLTR